MVNQIEKRRKIILESATRVFSEKGFSEATISEIADGANVAGSGIYKYYKNKEQLLFKIIEEFLHRSCEGLSDHLQGIQGAENKLRKAIWFHCRSYSGNKNEIKIVLESRSYPRFYRSGAYSALKSYAAMITGIIEEGMEEGVFPGISSPMILRDIILGTIDHIAINWTLKDAPDSLDQAEKIHDFVMRGIMPDHGKTRVPDKKAEKRVRIINTALALFSEKGFNDTSMLEIGKKANVAEGTVYEYFGSKENLLVSIPYEKLKGLYGTISGTSIERKIKGVILNIFDFYHKEKDYSKILVLMLRTNKRFHTSAGSQLIDNLFEIIKEAIEKGQSENIFRNDIDPDLCRNLLFGTLDHILIPWIIFDRDYDLHALGSEVADLFINAIRT